VTAIAGDAAAPAPAGRRLGLRGRREAAATLVLGLCLAGLGFRLGRWAVAGAIWSLPAGAGSTACRLARAEGACWAVIAERWRFILLGVYPFAEQWRPALACLLFAALYLASARRAWWRPWLLALWIAAPLAAVALLRGGFLGLAQVPSDRWGGLPVTLLLATVASAAGIPPAVALALGRRSRLPAIRVLCAGYIELIRGIPIVAFLFMAAIMFPLFMPPGFDLDKLLRAQIALVMVSAAYLAEVLRGGLQGVPAAQYEAAAAMGLSWWPALRFVILPQAFRHSIPALVNTFIAFFKDTALVTIIGLFDLLGAARTVLVDQKWVGFGVEVYLFVALVYFLFCFTLSRYSQHLEAVLMARGPRG
jgi:general L-amino acid transport system permease protein